MDKIQSKEELLAEEFGLDYSTSDVPTEPTYKKKDDDNIIYTSFFENKDYILEQIIDATSATSATYTQDAKNSSYVKYSKLNGEIETVKEILINNKTYRPITGKMVNKGVVGLPTGIEDYIDTNNLIKEVKSFLLYYFEPPKFYESFLPFYVLFTWVYDKFPFIAYLHFVGLSGTGKTVAAETLSSVCYKPIDAAGSATMSSMFRLADTWRGTIFLDEFEISSFGGEYSSILAFLKTGVGDRSILRTEGERKKEVEAFSVKSPKIFTSERPINNAGFQSRTFLIKMEKKRKRIPLYKLSNYYQRLTSLRNKLLKWRLENLGKIDLSKIEYGYPELEPFDGRVQQILTPMYYLSDDETRKDIVEFAKEQEKDTFRERQDSLEGQILQSILDHYAYPFEIALNMIKEDINKGNRKEIAERTIANIIRKVFNFDIGRVGHENIRCVIFDDNSDLRLEELRSYYGLPPANRSQRSQESQE